MALYSEVSPLPEFGTCDLEKRLVALPKIAHSEDMHARVSPTLTSVNITSRPLRGEHLTRLAALLTFCDPLPWDCLRLFDLSRKEWNRLLHDRTVKGQHPPVLRFSVPGHCGVIQCRILFEVIRDI